MADNETTLADEDGEYRDWIEIHNPDASAVNLDGYYLTDSESLAGLWRIPAVTIEAGGFLIIFASGKDRGNPNSELHTDFGLSAGGEYLALVAPDGVTVVSEFAAPYFQQDPDRSFGIAFDGTPLVQEGDMASILVPTSSVSSSWQSVGFVPGPEWIAGPTGVGFGLEVPGWTVREVASTSPLNTLADADRALAGSGVLRETTVISQVVNYLDTGSDGHFGSNLTFPNGGGDDFTLQATATVIIPTSGTWTFGMNSDDGGRIRIDGVNVMVDDTLHGAADHFGSRTLTAGPHTIEAMFFERGGGAEIEVFAAPGAKGTFDSTFRLIGDVDAGGLAVFTAPDAGGASGGSIATDIGDEMQGSNSSALVRIPFSASTPSNFESLSLSMRYNDGFSVYLNGNVVAQRNSPASPAWNSAATASRPSESAFVPEIINLTSAIPILNDGQNVLAVHGLNASAGDDNFLVLPELSAGGLQAGPPVFFDDPTPGTINAEAASMGKVADTQFTPDRGFYDAPIQVAISTLTEGTTIRYTTDGSAPSETQGTIYAGPITISQTTVLRAIAYKNGFDPTNVDTQTYVFLDDVIVQQANGQAPPGWPSGTVNGQIFNYGMDPEIVNSSNQAIGGEARVLEALQSIPTISLATDQANLTDVNTGIYTHAGNRGYAWERPASMELIFPPGYVDPDGNMKGFQVDMGLRIRGGFSRSGSNPKHAFRTFFRGEYGDTKLRYPIFGDEGADEFDNLDLRTSQNYSWAFGGDSRNTFMRDVWSRDLQRDMGQPYTRSRFYHLYLNGIYWGIYQTEERPEASFGETYFGGEKEDYDVMKSFGDIADGNRDAYTRLWQFWQSGFSSNAPYFQVQGKNPDGSPNPGYEKLVDLQNLIDYMIITYYTGDRDGPGSRFTQPRPNNYFGIYNRNNPDGFKFFEHDSEHSLGTGDNDMTFPFTSSSTVTEFNPHTLHEGLTQNLEYRTAFADRVQEALFNGGPLTVDSSLARLDARAAQIDSAIIAHSARWGDAKTTTPYSRNHWLSAVEQVRQFMRSRIPTLLSQLRARGWFPSIDAPSFSRHGGYVSSSTGLALSGGPGTIYYTSIGDDPRMVGGSLDGDASVFQGSTQFFTLVDAGEPWRFLDDGSDQGSAWRQSGFDDSPWQTGAAPLGYGDPVATTISFGSNPAAKHITSYFRKSFQVTGAGGFENLTLNLARDDGAVVYLNGTEIARSNMPAGTITYQTSSSTGVGGADETAFQSVSVDTALLAEGTNVLAVEVHQTNGASSDLYFDLSLRGSATVTSSPIVLAGPGEVTLKSRVRTAGGEWSALNHATFFVDLARASSANLIVTEVHYRPHSPSAAEIAAGFADRDDFEFIELKNIGSEHVHLRDVAFSDGIGFRFSDETGGTMIAPGAIVLLVKNQAAFEFRHGSGHPVAGEFSGNLSNDGEQVTLSAPDGVPISTFVFNDKAPWPEAADGSGYSLVYHSGDPADPANWSASAQIGGSPGSDEPAATGFQLFKAAHGIIDSEDDRDGDGWNALLEYVFAGDPDFASRAGEPRAGLETLDVGGQSDTYLVVRVRRRSGSDDVAVAIEHSTSMNAWTSGDGLIVLHDTIDHGDGTETHVYRSSVPMPIGEIRFVRVAVTEP